MPPAKLVEMVNISKSFPGVQANNRVSFDVLQGEIHALLGENGAGKTTLMNVLYGLYPADSGEIRWKDQPVHANTPRQAIKLGINMIHQHFMLVPKFTVVENIILGAPDGRRSSLDLKGPADRIQKLSETYGLELDPWVKVADLSVGAQQRVEIIKALYREAELLIMDEPTSVLAPGEVEHLFKVLQRLRSENRSVVFISHKLNEVLEISDRISVLRDGSLVGTAPNTRGLSRAELAQMMVGRPVTLQVQKPPVTRGEIVLKLENLHTSSESRRGNLHNLSLEVHRGEIVGIAGVDGNGQSELAEAVMGLRKVDEGRVRILGQDTTGWPTSRIRKLPLAYIPEERQKAGLVLYFPVRDNLALSSIGAAPYWNGWRIDYKELLSLARERIQRFRIATPGPMTQVEKLSGGNQQKVVLAREAAQRVDLIIACQATRGLDVDATRFVFEMMLEARMNGAGVLYISTELEEIMALSDTIAVIYQGQLAGILPRENADIKMVGLLMAGEGLQTDQARQTAKGQA
jgi:simple sugar transport system ATP-binding protein